MPETTMHPLTTLVVILALTCCAAARPTLSAQEARLASDTGIPADIAAKARVHGSSLERLVGMTTDFEEKPVMGLELNTAPAKGREKLRALRAQLAGTGYAAYLHDDRFGQGPDKIAIIKGGDEDYLAIVRTDGINYDLDHPRVMARYRQWKKQYGLKLRGAGHDWLEAEFVKPPRDWKQFAEEVYAFCPDVVDQGTGTAEALATEMQKSGTVYLWWD
jgi:hypothetical protein